MKKFLKVLILLVIVVIPFSLVAVGAFLLGRKLYQKYYKKTPDEIPADIAQNQGEE